MFTLTDLERAAALVRAVVPPTAFYAWPLLAHRTGAHVWIKHENHTPIGAFKVRGGIVYRAGLPCASFVPRGNSREKNAAMRAFGAELIVAGVDFDESREHAERYSRERGYHFVPSFHADLVKGVA